MDDLLNRTVREKLDAELVHLPKTIGIEFGIKLFAAFEQLGLIRPERSAVLSSTFGLATYPTYDGTHLAFVSSELGPNDYRIGKMRRAGFVERG